MTSTVRLTRQPPPLCNAVHSCELDWWPTDSEESFNKLIAQPQLRQQIESFGWHLPGAITYQFNSLGFRGNEPDWKNPLLMTFGCSWTMGIGLPQTVVWPWLVGAALNLPVVNFSMGGMSSDWCFRMAEYWVPEKRPVLAVMLAPAHERLELVVDHLGTGYAYSAQDIESDKFLQSWFAYSENARLNSVKNRLAFLALCRQVGVPALCYDAYEWFGKSREEIGFARDYMHGGPAGHKFLADKILNDWNEIKHA